MTTLPISIDLELDNQFVEDVIVGALEGGSNYWIDHVKINHPGGANPKDVPVSIWGAHALINGGFIVFYFDDDIARLELGQFIKGVGLWIKTNPSSMEIIKVNGKFTIDTCIIDAGDADNILQYALFEEVVYG